MGAEPSIRQWIAEGCLQRQLQNLRASGNCKTSAHLGKAEVCLAKTGGTPVPPVRPFPQCARSPGTPVPTVGFCKCLSSLSAGVFATRGMEQVSGPRLKLTLRFLGLVVDGGAEFPPLRCAPQLATRRLLHGLADARCVRHVGEGAERRQRHDDQAGAAESSASFTARHLVVRREQNGRIPHGHMADGGQFPDVAAHQIHPHVVL